ncbi:MAG: tyrosine-type recombinase/integrase [Gammaproteobacteria bacterium]|nr:tyrosine-type recombinase/integrase [Gammaproteobacteria bacterium]
MGRRLTGRLESPAKRAKLEAQSNPYWQTLPGGAVQLGYRVATVSEADARTKSGSRLERNTARPGAWSVRWWSAAGKEVRKSLRAKANDIAAPNGGSVLNFAQAKDAANAMFNQYHGAGDSIDGKMTVTDLFDKYAGYRDAKGSDTTYDQKRFEKHVKPSFGDVRLEDLTKAEIKTWLNGLVGKGANKVTRSTANRILSLWRASLNYGVTHLDVPSNIACWRDVQSFENADGKRELILTVREVRRLVSKCSANIRPLVEATVHTGARTGDLIMLRVRDVDLKRGTVRLLNQKIKLKVKRDPAYYVAIAGEALSFFERQVAGKSDDDFVITKADGSAWRKSQYYRELKAAVAKAKLDPSTSLYTLRHTRATNLLENGAPLLVVANSLGHQSTVMAEKTYLHPGDDYLLDQQRDATPDFGLPADKKIVSIDRKTAN